MFYLFIFFLNGIEQGMQINYKFHVRYSKWAEGTLCNKRKGLCFCFGLSKAEEEICPPPGTMGGARGWPLVAMVP